MYDATIEIRFDGFIILAYFNTLTGEVQAMMTHTSKMENYTSIQELIKNFRDNH